MASFLLRLESSVIESDVSFTRRVLRRIHGIQRASRNKSYNETCRSACPGTSLSLSLSCTLGVAKSPYQPRVSEVSHRADQPSLQASVLSIQRLSLFLSLDAPKSGIFVTSSAEHVSLLFERTVQDGQVYRQNNGCCHGSFSDVANKTFLTSQHLALL